MHDEDRIGYLRGHLDAVHDAIAGGADVRGYYPWSLVDNFEWAWGNSKRFGIVHVDFESGERRLNDSALWYRTVVERNAVERNAVE